VEARMATGRWEGGLLCADQEYVPANPTRSAYRVRRASVWRKHGSHRRVSRITTRRGRRERPFFHSTITESAVRSASPGIHSPARTPAPPGRESGALRPRGSRPVTRTRAVSCTRAVWTRRGGGARRWYPPRELKTAFRIEIGRHPSQAGPETQLGDRLQVTAPDRERNLGDPSLHHAQEDPASSMSLKQHGIPAHPKRARTEHRLDEAEPARRLYAANVLLGRTMLP